MRGPYHKGFGEMAIDAVEASTDSEEEDDERLDQQQIIGLVEQDTSTDVSSSLGQNTACSSEKELIKVKRDSVACDKVEPVSGHFRSESHSYQVLLRSNSVVEKSALLLRLEAAQEKAAKMAAQSSSACEDSEQPIPEKEEHFSVDKENDEKSADDCREYRAISEGCEKVKRRSKPVVIIITQPQIKVCVYSVYRFSQQTNEKAFNEQWEKSVSPYEFNLINVLLRLVCTLTERKAIVCHPI